MTTISEEIEFKVEGFYPKHETNQTEREWKTWMTCGTLEDAERLVEGAAKMGGSVDSFTKLRVVKVVKQRVLISDEIHV